MVENGHTARALAMVYAGFSLASVAGVSLGAAVCRTFGWRWTYALILAMAVVLLPVLRRVLPGMQPPPPGREAFSTSFPFYMTAAANCAWE